MNAHQHDEMQTTIKGREDYNNFHNVTCTAIGFQLLIF